MRFKRIISLYEAGNVCVYGLRGSGKDLLTSNVIVRRERPYVSNVDYGEMYFPLDLSLLDCGRNTYKEFISQKLNQYVFPYPEHTDVYVSDAGVYFPAQYCNQLNNLYPYLATFQALSRHVGLCNFHVNSQALNRVWDKIREQSDTYILCRWCRVLFGKLVIQSVCIYDKYDSALAKAEPFRLRTPLFGAGKSLVRIEKARFQQTYGLVKRGLLIYRVRSNYDDRSFNTLLGGVRYDKKKCAGTVWSRVKRFCHSFLSRFKRKR